MLRAQTALTSIIRGFKGPVAQTRMLLTSALNAVWRQSHSCHTAIKVPGPVQNNQDQSGRDQSGSWWPVMAYVDPRLITELQSAPVALPRGPFLPPPANPRGAKRRRFSSQRAHIRHMARVSELACYRWPTRPPAPRVPQCQAPAPG